MPRTWDLTGLKNHAKTKSLRGKKPRKSHPTKQEINPDYCFMSWARAQHGLSACEYSHDDIVVPRSRLMIACDLMDVMMRTLEFYAYIEPSGEYNKKALAAIKAIKEWRYKPQ